MEIKFVLCCLILVIAAYNVGCLVATRVQSNSRLVLSLVRKLQPNAYGLSILDALKEGRHNWSLGGVYTILFRLESAGEVRRVEDDNPVKECGGHRRLLWEVVE